MHYEVKRNRINTMGSVLLVIFGTMAAGAAERMIENSIISTLAIIGICVVLLGLSRGLDRLLIVMLNREAEKNGDPRPF